MSTTPALSYGNHIRPEEVTPEMRRQLARDEWIGEMVRNGLIAVLTVFVSLGISLAYRWRGEQDWAELYLIVPLLIVVGVISTVLHFRHKARREFALHGPVTPALVVEEKQTLHFSDDSAIMVPKLLLRYVPEPGVEGDLERLRSANEAWTVWVELSGLSSDFEEKVQPNQLVTILYDPREPKHVQVIERDRAA